MTKKAIAIIMTVLLSLSMITIAFAAGTPTITVSSAAAEPGETVTLNVALSNNPGINTFSLAFDYDTSKLNLTSVELADGISGQFAYGKKAVWLNSKDSTVNGNYLVATFEVLENATAGDARVAVTYGAGEISNYDEEDVDFELVSGKVTVISDVSADGTIEVGTATAVPGTTVTVPVSITKNPGINTFSLGFDYDTTKLELVDVAINETPGGQFAYGKKAVWLSGKDTTYTGEILTLTFKVKESVADGDVPVDVTCTVGEISNYDEEDLIFDLVAGKVTVKTTVGEDAPQIAFESVRVTAGQEVKVDLSLKNNPGIAGLAISLIYDSNYLTLKDIENKGLFSGFTSGKQLAFDESKNVTQDGAIATLVVETAENIPVGEYEIGAIVRSCTNIDIEDVDLAVNNGVIAIVDFMYGDANGDELIDMKDVVLLRKYIVNFDYDTQTSDVKVSLGADANGDELIDMKDVVLLRKYIVNFDYDLGSSSVVLGPQ